jgi:tetratricopeptide (TPR) repeat protein
VIEIDLIYVFNYCGTSTAKGLALGKLGRYQEAIRGYVYAIELNPNDIFA